MGSAPRAWTVMNGVFAALFVVGAAVQVNDPDPLPWMAVYGLAAAACVAAGLRRGHRALPALVALGAVAWAATLAPRVVGRVEFLSMFGAFEMESVAIEEAREMYGLLLVAGWMVVLALRRTSPGAGAGERPGPSGREEPPG